MASHRGETSAAIAGHGRVSLTIRVDLWVMVYAAVACILFAALEVEELAHKYGNPRSLYYGLVIIWGPLSVGLLGYGALRWAVQQRRAMRGGWRRFRERRAGVRGAS